MYDDSGGVDECVELWISVWWSDAVLEGAMTI